MSSSRSASSVNSDTNLLQQQYVAAYYNKDYPLMLEIAQGHPNTLCLNPTLIEDVGDPKDFVMTLAAEMILNPDPQALQTLRIISTLPGFNLNTETKTSLGTPPVDLLHEACSNGHKDLVEMSLAALGQLSTVKAKAYLNCPVSRYDDIKLSPFLFAFGNLNCYSKEICELIYAAGADPYVFFDKQNDHISLFCVLDVNSPAFNDYIDMLKRNPQKLAAFLNKKMTMQTVDGVYYINLLEESLLSLQQALKCEFKNNKKHHSHVPYTNKDEFLANASPELLSFIEKARRIRLLYQECFFDLPKNNNSTQKRNWKHVSKLASMDYIDEMHHFFQLFSSSNDGFMHSSSENAAYLSVENHVDDQQVIAMVDSFAGLTAPYICAMNPNYRSRAGRKPTAICQDDNKRRENRPYFGTAKGHTPLTLAAIRNSVDYIKDAISVNHPDLDAPVVFGPFTGLTPIMLAIFNDNHKIVELLLIHFFRTKNRSASKFYDAPLSGHFAGLTLKAAMEYASHENKILFKQLIAGTWKPGKSVASSKPTTAQQPVAKAVAAPVKLTKQKKSYKPTNELKTAEIADLTASSSSSSSSTRNSDIQKANQAVKVYLSLLQQMRQDARDKVALLNGLISDEKGQLDNMLGELEAITMMTEVANDEEPDVKLSECQTATDALTKMMLKFNGLYKKCERTLVQKPAVVTISDDNNDDNDAVEVEIAAATPQPTTPVVEKPKPNYDTHGMNYTVLQPAKAVKTNKTKKATSKPALTGSNSMFNAKTVSSTSSALQKNKRAHSLLSDFNERIGRLRKSYLIYQDYCASKNNNGLFDVDSAIAVSAMTAEALASYETLLTLQRDYPTLGVFSDAASAAAWRDMSKYAYVYIFSHEAGYFTTLMAETLGLIANAVSNRLRDNGISVISSKQRPSALVQAARIGGGVASQDELAARYKNILAIIENLNARVQKSGGTLEIHQDSVRAKLFCLSLLGQVIKDGGAPKGLHLNHTYSQTLRTKILCHTAGESFISDAKTETVTPLLNFFAAALKTENGKEEVKAIISQLTASDSALLLREILNATSHKFDSEWVTLDSPHIRTVADCIAMQCERVFGHVPPTHEQRAIALLNILNSWSHDNSINQNALKHPFFSSLKSALQCIADGKPTDTLTYRSMLLVSVGASNRFDMFAKNFAITGKIKETLDQAYALLTEVDKNLTQTPDASMSMKI